jgi:uncharacterized membrane protein YoaT (DUF817 family)
MSRNKIFSGLLAATYIVVALCGGGAEAGLRVAIYLVLPLALIWFGEPKGDHAGPTWRAAITAPKPVLFVCIAGWLLLVVPAIIVVVHVFTRSKP